MPRASGTHMHERLAECLQDRTNPLDLADLAAHHNGQTAIHRTLDSAGDRCVYKADTERLQTTEIFT